MRGRAAADDAGPRPAGLTGAWRALLGRGGRRPDRCRPEQAPPPGRLGTAQLGKYAHEEAMPRWLARALHRRGQVSTQGVVPVLEQLLRQCAATKAAYLCHPCVQHVSKLRSEGGFCGYRNIQALVSYVVGAHAPGRERFGDDGLPSVLDIQDLIERAWDRGFNAQGRIETGGIRGTRKYIGTPEAQALFCSLDIPCSVQAFGRAGAGRPAASALLRAVEDYFRQGWHGGDGTKVRCTRLPPIYLQHHGHSVTIVGIETQRDSQVQLLVFDPSSRDRRPVRRLIGRARGAESAAKAGLLLDPYRRGTDYLSRHDKYETLW